METSCKIHGKFMGIHGNSWKFMEGSWKIHGNFMETSWEIHGNSWDSWKRIQEKFVEIKG